MTRQCVFVVGTRAQLIKVAPVLREAVAANLEHVVWLTGQHNESMDDLIEDFELQSKFIMPSQWQERSSLSRLLSWLPRTLFKCTRYLSQLREQSKAAPLVIVHGDTLSTLLGAIAGRLVGGWIVHLESGLSSEKITDPFPEELLRRLTFRLTKVALCPNDEAYERMQKFGKCEAVHTGENTLLDCVRLALERSEDDVDESRQPYFVASLHRFQNIYSKKNLTQIVEELIALSAIASVHFILHPATRFQLEKHGLYEALQGAPGIRLHPRLPYTSFLSLVAHARGVISDGGSNQEELSYLGIPTILFRGRSERPDGLGENVEFRRNISVMLPNFVCSEGFKALQKGSRIHELVEPSKVSVQVLTELSLRN